MITFCDLWKQSRVTATPVFQATSTKLRAAFRLSQMPQHNLTALPRSVQRIVWFNQFYLIWEKWGLERLVADDVSPRISPFADEILSSSYVLSEDDLASFDSSSTFMATFINHLGDIFRDLKVVSWLFLTRLSYGMNFFI
jgi:hypothetical protein